MEQTTEHVVVISCGLKTEANAVERCKTSIASQRGNFTAIHIILDVTHQSPLLASCENLWNSIEKLNDDDIVALVDLDDYLAHENVLQRVIQEYIDPNCWLTYGHVPQSCRGPCPYNELRMQEPWRLTHLKTFRAGLFKSIPPKYLQFENGTWINRANDRAFMVAMCEMAGPNKYRYIPDFMYVYDGTASKWNRDARTEMLSLKRIYGMSKLTPISDYRKK